MNENASAADPYPPELIETARTVVALLIRARSDDDAGADEAIGSMLNEHSVVDVIGGWAIVVEQLLLMLEGLTDVDQVEILGKLARWFAA
ncbi:MAG: hypothetical protein H0W36_07615 [Gemmatimonadetes bacterium]|nr:hypothetical protein [Gemmatimonadota bacterium]